MNSEGTDENGLAPYLVDFLEYRQFFLSVGQLPESTCWNNALHSNAIKRVEKVMREVRIIRCSSLVTIWTPLPYICL